MDIDRDKILKIAGVTTTICGGALLYLSGAGQDMAIELIGAVFLIAGIIANFLK